MKISSLEFRNFGSYGSTNQVISLEGESSFNLIVGSNGNGKSTIADAIRFALFGKVPNKKLKDIVNRHNGKAWVRIKFSTSDGKRVVVERTADPTSITLTVDGVPYTKANQGPSEYLTEQLIEIPTHVFNNVVLISCNDFKGFLSMSANDKRLIIDKLFGFADLNLMRKILSDKTKLSQNSFIRCEGSVSAIQQQINDSTRKLELMSDEIKSLDLEKERELEDLLQKFTQLLAIHAEKTKEASLEMSEVRSSTLKIRQNAQYCLQNEQELEKKLQLYNDDKCPMCQSDLTVSWHTDYANHLREQIKSFKEERAKIVNTLRIALDAEKKVEEKVEEINNKGYKIRSKIHEIQDQLSKLRAGTGAAEKLDVIRKMISEMESKIINARHEKNKIEQEIVWNKILDEALGEKGIKQLAIRSILPSANAEINRMMGEMQLPFSLKFNESFDAELTDCGVDASPESLSFGERAKVNFVVLVAMLKIMKTRYPAVNILFLDEIFSNIDQDGIMGILDILSKTTRELSLHAFVISHMHNIPMEPFDYRIDVQKNNGFSTLCTEKL
jgi:exonuclease SbcC